MISSSRINRTNSQDGDNPKLNSRIGPRSKISHKSKQIKMIAI